MQWHTLRTIRTPNVTLRVEWTYDDDYELDVQDEHGNPCQETADKLASGEWSAYGFRVTVHIAGIPMGEDSIWGSIYEDPEDAMRKRISGYLASLVKEACRDARKVFRTLPAIRAA